jgi:hypothetical protein
MDTNDKRHSLTISRTTGVGAAEHLSLKLWLGQNAISVRVSPADLMRALTDQARVPCAIELAEPVPDDRSRDAHASLLADEQEALEELVPTYGSDGPGRRLPPEVVAAHLVASSPGREWLDDLCERLERRAWDPNDWPAPLPSPGDVSNATAILDRRLFPKGRGEPPLSVQKLMEHLICAARSPTWLTAVWIEIKRLRDLG